MSQKTNTELHILAYLQAHPAVSSKEMYDEIQFTGSYATIKRAIQQLVTRQYIVATGKGKATRYAISPSYKLLYPIDVEAYFEKEVDQRKIKISFNHELISDLLPKVSLFTEEELKYLGNLQQKYTRNREKLTEPEYKKEMERLAIDLSWKSSQIEGNTYSLLETERLLKDKETAAGKTKDEAVMLLNHKDALDFILKEPAYIYPLTVRAIEDIHSILMKDLGVDRNMRRHRVGITGTNYKPLDNEFQIREALEEMCKLVNNEQSVFAKTLLVLTLISYIQAFADGNKRTARIISNAILLNNEYCPISFRTIDPIDYKKSVLIFYEQNNITAFKRIFIDQFEFAVNTYF